MLVIVIVIASLSLGVIATSAYAHRGDSRTIKHVDNNGLLSIDQAKRTECRSIRAAALDKARWDIVFNLLSHPDVTPAQAVAAGIVGTRLPAIDELTDKGGRVGRSVFPPCPKSIANRKAA
jgi:hypothetical protein